MSTIETLIVKYEKLIEAAAQAFAQATYDGVSTTDVAKRAGVSQPYVMQVFGNKQRLYSSVQKFVYNTLVQLVRDTPEATDISFLQGGSISRVVPPYYLEFLQRSLQSSHHPFIAQRIRILYKDFIDLLVVERKLSHADVATKISRSLSAHFISLIGATELLQEHPDSAQVLNAMLTFELSPPTEPTAGAP